MLQYTNIYTKTEPYQISVKTTLKCPRKHVMQYNSEIYRMTENKTVNKFSKTKTQELFNKIHTYDIEHKINI
jgi:hypothetical protein